MGQWAALVASAGIVTLLVTRPATGLTLLWSQIIPVLPAVFLVNPAIWRNVCPLATVNEIAARTAGRKQMADGRGLRLAWVGGMLLFAVLVPARRFLFDTRGSALAATIVAVGGLAFALGSRRDRRAGFCNSWCPVLPVEKLYGQAPLLRVGSARCGACTLCTASGCIDLAESKAAAQTLGRARRDDAWVLSPLGAFAAAFPGVVIGFFSIADGSLGTAGAAYLHVGAGALASWVLVVAVARVAKLCAADAMPALAGLTALAYYWLAAPGVARAYGGASAATIGVRAAATALVGVWWWRGKVRRAG